MGGGSINSNNFFTRVAKGEKNRERVGRSSGRTTPRDALYRGVRALHEDCVSVSWTKTFPSPPFLPLLCRETRNPANLFTFPKCQDKLGGLRVSAQSARQGGLFLCASSSSARRQGSPTSQEDSDKPGSPGEGGPCLRRDEHRQATRGPGCGLCAGQAGRGGRSSSELGGVGLGAEGTWRGFHPRMHSRTLASSPLPPFLKAKAVIYSPFRFSGVLAT